MQLRLDDEYVVKSDNFCFKLGKYIKKIDKEGNEIEVFSPKEYHTTLSSVLNSYVNNKLKNSKSKDKKELTSDLEQINKQINLIFNRIREEEDVYISTFRKILNKEVDLEELDDEEN